MLTELHIENLGVIGIVDLVFSEGLTAITGETGAGKTMLVEALDLVVGGRADPVIVRPGAAEARIDARFVAEDREVVLTRIVPASGRSRAYVDGRPVTVTGLSDVAVGLVDLHGQHAHQQLLTPASQRAALDAFGGIDLGPLRAARARLTELDAELAMLGGDERARARELDLARFQLRELDEAAIEDPDEESVLEELEDTLASAVEHRQAGVTAVEALSADGGARDGVAGAAAALSGRAPFRALADRLADVLAELDDVSSSVRDAAESIDDDPQRLEEVRARRQQLRELCRKYGDTLTDVTQFHREVSARVADLEVYE
ncbi:MAG: AAA family ATPase, partial [Acidimicrobiales bacterium]